MVGMRPDNKAGRGFEIKVSRQQMVPFRRIRFERCAARALIRAGLEQTQPERQSICRKRRQFADRRYALVQKLRQMVNYIPSFLWNTMIGGKTTSMRSKKC